MKGGQIKQVGGQIKQVGRQINTTETSKGKEFRNEWKQFFA